MDQHGPEAATIVGHSGGSYAAQRFAIDHPHRVKALILIGAFDAFTAAPGIIDELAPAVAALTDPVDPEFVLAFQESTIVQPIPDGWMDIVLEESAKLPAHVWQAWMTGYVAAAAPTQTGRITAPTLLVWGDRDTFCTREAQDALLAAIPGSRLAVHAGTGHAVHWEQPQRVAAQVAEFVAQSAAMVTLRPDDLAAARAS